MWARGAIEGFSALVQSQRAIFRASQEGSERGAESLSPRPFQGILESIQNADDVGATEIRFRLVRGRPSELLIVHNGAPVDLSHAGAMALPWLTTKSDEAEASGRFGIGQKTLRSLGGPIEVHCSPFHFLLGPNGPEWVEPAPDIAGFYNGAARETLMRVRLGNRVRTNELLGYLVGLGAGSLVFLRTVRRIVAWDGASGAPTTVHSLVAEGSAGVEMRIRNQPCTTRWLLLRDVTTGVAYHRYMVDVPVSQGEQRRHKASGATATLGVAVRLGGEGTGGFYDRLPLPLESGFTFSLNAQFDPDAARTEILPVEWNERRLDDLADLVALCAADCMARDPRAAWSALPLPAEIVAREASWLSVRLRRFVERALAKAGTGLAVPTAHGPRRFQELVYEAEPLDGLLTNEDQERLAPKHFAVPASVRDPAGRWRSVLDGMARSQSLDVERSLDLFDLDDEELGKRDGVWFVAMADAAISTELLEELLWKRSILLENGERIEPPGGTDPRTLVASGSRDDLAVALGVALPIHRAYLTRTRPATAVVAALRDAGLLLADGGSPQLTFEVLARPGGGTEIVPLRISEEQLVHLRDAFEALDEERQTHLGPRVGRNVELLGFTYDETGARQRGWVRPVDAYLPSAIDRETASFARAAASTPDLKWIDSSYSRVLKRAGGRREIGAQRFLVRLGSATQPRLIRPENEVSPWARDARPASPISGLARPDVQVREIRALSPARTYLIGDRWSPDLDLVIDEIAEDRNAKRRKARGLALLAVLSRSWDRHYGDHQTAKAVHAYNGYWHDPHDVIATWLARAVEAKWLPSGTGAVRAPLDLALPTEANRIAHGTDRRRFLATVDDSILRGQAVDALRLRRGPAASSLVAHLQALAASPIEATTHDEAMSSYQLLALACSRDGRAAPVDDMTQAEFRAAFTGSARSPGLVLVDHAWRSPKEVLAGPHVFGRHRAFVPHFPALQPLWRTLGIREPTTTDCIAILRELARSPLETDDIGVVIETARWLANHLSEMAPQARSQLGKLPLWTGARWITARPIWATEDPALTNEISSQVATWVHGLTSFTGLEDLLDALRVTTVRREDFAPVGISARDHVIGSELRPRFASAVKHLRDELARNDQALYESISVEWSSLAAAEMLIDEDLTLESETNHGVTLTVRAQAHLLRDPLALVVRSSAEAGASDSGGRAVASLFTGDRQKVAWAWASMWQRAAAGVPAAGVVLSEEGGAGGDGSGALLRLKGQAASRRGRGTSRSSKTSPGGGSATRGEVIVRKLKDIVRFRPDGGTLVNEGQGQAGILFPTAKPITKPEPSDGGRSHVGDGPGQGPASSSQEATQGGQPTGRAKRRSVPAPVDDREQLAFDAVQSALALDPPEIQDLRARRGIGADAMDDLRHLFEIKMSSGEMTNDVTLLKSQAEAALDPDFFLAIVSGLDEGGVPLSVRFIFDPLRRLQQRITGDVTLTGMRDVEALEYRFEDTDGLSETLTPSDLATGDPEGPVSPG